VATPAPVARQRRAVYPSAWMMTAPRRRLMTLHAVLKMVRVQGAFEAATAKVQGCGYGAVAAQVVVRFLQDRGGKRTRPRLAQGRRFCRGAKDGRDGHQDGSVDLADRQATRRLPWKRPARGTQHARQSRVPGHLRLGREHDGSAARVTKTTNKTRRADIDVALERKAIREKSR
jgi:hypothetical protein